MKDKLLPSPSIIGASRAGLPRTTIGIERLVQEMRRTMLTHRKINTRVVVLHDVEPYYRQFDKRKF